MVRYLEAFSKLDKQDFTNVIQRDWRGFNDRANDSPFEIEVLVWYAFLLLYKSPGFIEIPTTKPTSHASVGNLAATSPDRRFRDILLQKSSKVIRTNRRRIRKYSPKAHLRVKFLKKMTSQFITTIKLCHQSPFRSWFIHARKFRKQRIP